MKPRYIEPDATAPEYAGAARKSCTKCGRVLPDLPDLPDFFSVHTVIAPDKRTVYRYRRPECRKCRAEQYREYRRKLREIDKYIDNGGREQ